MVKSMWFTTEETCTFIGLLQLVDDDVFEGRRGQWKVSVAGHRDGKIHESYWWNKNHVVSGGAE